jgi:hypothetical protein
VDGRRENLTGTRPQNATAWPRVYWQMMTEVLTRLPRHEGYNSLRTLVQAIVDKVYGGLCGPPPLVIDGER